MASPRTYAELSVGPAFTGATSGRVVPSLFLGLDISSFIVTYYGTGVSTSVYYQVTNQIGFLKKWSKKPFLWGQVEPALGGAALFSQRGYSPNPSTQQVTNDFTLGPDFRVSWYLSGPVFLSVDVLFGLQSLYNLFYLAPQDEANLVLGISL